MNKIKILFSLLLLTNYGISQTVTDTVKLCVRDTVCFVNHQENNCMPNECGFIVTVVDSNSTESYELIPSDYVFDPPFQSVSFTEKFCVNFFKSGKVKIRFTEYDFGTGRVVVAEKLFVIGSCRDTIVSGTTDTVIIVFPIKNEERKYNNFYLPSAFNPQYSSFFPFTESHYETNIVSMIVCTASGNIVYENHSFPANDPNSGWSGDNAPVGVYFWEVKTTTLTKSGAVILSK